MSIFKGLNEAPIGYVRQYFEADCRYLVKIIHCKGKTAAESFKGNAVFIVEAEILKKSAGAKLAIGTTAGWVVPIKPGVDKQRMAFGNIKQFFSAALSDPELGGVDVEEMADAAISDANPFEDIVLGLVTVGKTTRGNGGIFTAHQWYPAEGFEV